MLKQSYDGLSAYKMSFSNADVATLSTCVVASIERAVNPDKPNECDSPEWQWVYTYEGPGED